MRRGPHWLLSDPDAKAYGTALSNALRHLPITAAQKTIDFAALGIAVMAYELPRVGIDMQLRAQRQAQAQARRQPQGPAQVFQFRPNSPPPQSATPQQPVQPPVVDGFASDMTYEPDMEGAAN